MTLIRIGVRVAAANWIHVVPASLLLFHALGQPGSTLLKVHHRYLSSGLPAIEHLHFALVPVYAAVRSADRRFRLVLAVQRACVRLTAGGALAGHAERHRHLEHVLAAVLRSHFTGVRVEDPVAAAGWLGTAPTRFTTMSGGLTVFFVRTHDALSAGEQFHLTRGLVDVPVASADGSVQGCELAGDRAVLPVSGYVVAGSEVGQLDPDTAYLDPQHALVQIRASVCAAYRILIARATMLALATG